jgi:hypothetical protein
VRIDAGGRRQQPLQACRLLRSSAEFQHLDVGMSNSFAQLMLLQAGRDHRRAHRQDNKAAHLVAVALLMALSFLCGRAAADEYRYPRYDLPFWGFIDGSGQMAIPAQFFGAGRFSEGLAPVRIEAGCGYVDAAGAIKLRLTLSSCRPFSSGRAGFKSEATGRWGFYAPDGRVAIPARFERAQEFSEGFAAVREGTRWAYIDTQGRRLSKDTYSDAMSFSEGLAAVAPDDLFGFIDRLGRMVIEPRYKAVRPFREGLASVKTDRGWGYIDKSGAFASPHRWTSFADDYSEGLAAVWIGSKRGFIRRDGSTAIQPRFVDSTHFSGGMAAVKTSDRTDQPTWMYIDKEGKSVFARRFWDAEPFVGPLALVQLEPRRGQLLPMGYLDRRGEVVATFTQHDGISAIRALRFEPTPIDVRLLSRPPGAFVYMVPLFDWERGGPALLQSPSLPIYRVGNGVTDMTEKVYERVYVAVFERDGQRTCRRVDVKRDQLNEVTAELTEPCR